MKKLSLKDIVNILTSLGYIMLIYVYGKVGSSIR